MVNITKAGHLAPIRRVVGAYVVIALATVAALAALQMALPRLATQEAWGHAVIVGVFAVVLGMRARAAGQGKPGALRAVTIIGCVLLVVNLVEAILPGVFPVWMRVEMAVIAVLMLVLVFLTVRAQRKG